MTTQQLIKNYKRSLLNQIACTAVTRTTILNSESNNSQSYNIILMTDLIFRTVGQRCLYR